MCPDFIKGYCPNGEKVSKDEAGVTNSDCVVSLGNGHNSCGQSIDYGKISSDKGPSEIITAKDSLYHISLQDKV